MPKVNLSSPWERFYKEMRELFGEDPDITVLCDEKAQEVSLYVNNPSKADALTQILPAEKVFGNITVKITVVPANDQESQIALFQRAFDGNPAFAFTYEAQKGAYHTPYVVFTKKVVQYFSDNLAALDGVTSTLYEDIARRVFGDDSEVFFCTETDDGVEFLVEG